MVVNGGGYVLAGDGRWWVMVDIFWLGVGGGGYILVGSGWWWVVVDIFWLVVGGGIIYSDPYADMNNRNDRNIFKT